MKSLSAQLQAHLQGETTTLVTCAKIVLTKYPPRIVAVSQANPGVITTRWAHGLMTGDTVKIRNVRGMVQLNRKEYAVTVIDDFNFSIGVDTTSYDLYTHKGVAQKVVGYTEYFKDLVFDGVTYKSTLAYTPQSVRQGSEMATDTVEHRGILTNAAKNEVQGLAIDGITDEDLIAGFYDNAEMEIFIVNYENLTQGRLILPVSGRLGEVTLRRGIYETELAGKTAFLQEELTEIYTAQCRADLGDDYDGSEPEHELQQGFGCKVRLNPPLWQAETAYELRTPQDAGAGAVVAPSSYNGLNFVATVAGTSGATEPTWNTTVGGTTVDGSVIWTTIAALTKTGAVSAVLDRRRFIDANRDEAPMAGLGGVSTLFPIIAVNQGTKTFTIAGNFATEFPALSRFTIVGSAENDGTYTIASSTGNGGNTDIVVTASIPGSAAGGSIVGRLPDLVGYFTYGKLTFLDGKNKGIAREVKSFSVSTVDGIVFTGPGAFELFESFPFDIQVGDAYEVHAGCDKSLTMCVNKFDNVHNRRAEDNIPGTDKALLYPDAK